MTDAGPSSGAGGAMAGGASGSGGAIFGAGGGILIVGSGGTGGLGPGQCSFTVELPPEGVPADPGEICAASMVPVDSNRAAFVMLQSTGSAPTDGTIRIDPALLPLVVGTPTLKVIDATDPALLGVKFDAVTTSPGGFAFKIHWPSPLNLNTDGMTRVTVQVSLELSCPPETQLVHSATDIHLCRQELNDGGDWVSSGQVCSVCRIIAEMAPSPIVPDKANDALPLAQVLRLRIVELARVANVVVLLAENDGGGGLEYEWQASAGKIEHLAPDVVAWTLEEGLDAPSIHAAVWGLDAAAVASFAFNVEVA
jgi:hypothetical protein